MRTTWLALLAALSFAPLAYADVPAFSKAPTEDFLHQLDNAQLQILRDNIVSCGRVGASNTNADPCVIARTDEAIAKAGNADLATFHNSIPRSVRYDETRDTTYWRVWLPKK